MPKRVLEEIAKDMAAESIGKKMKRSSGAEWLERESIPCPHCGTMFLPKNFKQVTCGARKCQIRQNLVCVKRRIESAICDVCGKDFTRTVRKDPRRTCSETCANAIKTGRKKNKKYTSRTTYSEPFEVDFSQLHTMNSEFPTMDCPECDPLTNRMYENWIVIAQPQPKRKAA